MRDTPNGGRLRVVRRPRVTERAGEAPVDSRSVSTADSTAERGAAERAEASAPPGVATDSLLRFAPLELELLEHGPRGAEGLEFDLVLLPVFSDERPLLGLAGMIDWRVCGRLSRLLRRDVCTGRPGEAVMTTVERCRGLWRVILFGLGPSEELDDEAAAAAADRVYGIARSVGAHQVLVGTPGGCSRSEVGARFVTALARRVDEAIGDEMDEADGDAREGAEQPESGAAGRSRWWAVLGAVVGTS